VHVTRKLRDGVFIDMAAQAPQSRPLETYTSLMLTGRLFGLIGMRDRYDRGADNPRGSSWQCARAESVEDRADHLRSPLCSCVSITLPASS
jgi:hypothetical protein